MSGRRKPARLISTAQAARIWGVKPVTYRVYISRGYAPEPVGWDMHDERAVREARKLRPGRGTRTDRW